MTIDANNRKIVQISTISPNKTTLPLILALCDDGTVWGMSFTEGGKWRMIDPVPQPK